ncbi:MAG: deoxyribose-phosphate aldolase [Metamycoplasmataceae bacterium]
MDISKFIDHTLLKPEATEKDIDKLILEAEKYNFYSVCINSSWVKYAKEKIKSNDLKITSVVGFPLGANIMQNKVQEAELAVKHGADEIDMVINIGRLKDGQYDYVLNEIKKIKQAIGSKVLKVIVETALLKDYEIEKITEIVLGSGADFIKTSTGFSYRGASFSDIEIFNKIIKGKNLKIKAAGGIKNINDAMKYIEMGVSRLGTSSSVELVSNKEIKGY